MEEYGFGAQSGLKVIRQTLVRAGGLTLGYFRERLALEVAKNMAEWGGCRLAPFPSNPMRFHLPRSRFKDTVLPGVSAGPVAVSSVVPAR